MNLQEETRSGYVVPAQMKKVWAVQMELLNKLLEVCGKYQLKVWVDGGTLLGAVRHKGYIPWDDDIDLVMLRDDYDKLVRLAPKEFSHPYFFQCAYTEKYYPRGHAQIRMDGTTAILPIPQFVDTHQGIFIDIFPFDAVPDDPVARKELIAKRNARLSTLLGCGLKPSIKHPGRSFRSLMNRPRFKSLYAQFEEMFRANKVDDNAVISCLSFVVDPEHLFRDKHWYDSTLYLPFEDIMVPVPVGYHEILQLQYGDYMVPRQAPTNHGHFWKLDAERPYQEFIPALKKQIRRGMI